MIDLNRVRHITKSNKLIQLLCPQNIRKAVTTAYSTLTVTQLFLDFCVRVLHSLHFGTVQHTTSEPVRFFYNRNLQGIFLLLMSVAHWACLRYLDLETT